MDNQVQVTYNTELFFKQLKSSKKSHGFQDIIRGENLRQRVHTINKMIHKAERAGQKEKSRQLNLLLTNIDAQVKAIDAGYNKVLSLTKVQELLNQLADKDVRVFDLQDYTGTIPDEVVDQIEDINKNHYFDNMVIIGTDYTGEDTKRMERKRDPVLLGLIGNENDGVVSNELFFIADWDDPDVGLTLEQMIDEYSKNNDDDLVTEPKVLTRSKESFTTEYDKAIAKLKMDK